MDFPEVTFSIATEAVLVEAVEISKSRHGNLKHIVVSTLDILRAIIINNNNVAADMLKSYLTKEELELIKQAVYGAD